MWIPASQPAILVRRKIIALGLKVEHDIHSVVEPDDDDGGGGVAAVEDELHRNSIFISTN